MNEQDFYGQLADILDADEVKPIDNLRDFEAWDSLAVLSIVAMADSKFGFTLTFPEVKTLVTADDLWKYFAAKRTK